MKLIELLIERKKREEKFFKNYPLYAQKIKKTVEKLLKEKVQVFIFGSILKKDEIPRDIDLLIISEQFRNRVNKTQARVKIWKKIGIGNPFEVHLITPEEYEEWYKFFVKEKIEI